MSSGTGNMAKETNRCAANIQRCFPGVQYYHCTSHSLNLALSKACKIGEISNTMATPQALRIFFKFLPKHHHHLQKTVEKVTEETKSLGQLLIKQEKVKLLHETRWVRWHTTLQDFNEMYEASHCMSGVGHC